MWFKRILINKWQIHRVRLPTFKRMWFKRILTNK